MAPQKLVVKCGNVAVLLDVHALPRGAQEQDTSWMTSGHLEEVAALVQQAVEQRVKQHAESLHHRGQAKQRKDPPPATAFRATGTSFNLVANFLKRHHNLRCLLKDRYGELRVFAERCVVCVSRPEEEVSARRGNPSQAATEWGEQSRSEYFSRVGVTQEPLHSAVKTKRSALQKIVRQVEVRRQDQGPGVGSVHTGAPAGGHGASPGEGERPGVLGHRDPAPPQPLPQGVELSRPPESPTPEPPTRLPSPGDLRVQEKERRGNVPSQEHQASGAGVSSSQPGPSQEPRGGKRAQAGSTAGQPPAPHAKRPCVGGPPGESLADSSSQTSGRDRPAPPPPPALLPPPSPPLPPTVGAKAASTASPVSARRLTTGEAELLTPGKRRLPLTSAEQTNQNRPAASLTGPSAGPASPARAVGCGGVIGGEAGRENVPRVSRLRRPRRP